MADGTTIYDRCGGYAGFRKIAEDILKVHHANPVLEVRYGHAKKSDDELARLVTELLCSVTGGSETYSGMSMLDAHQGMNCSEEEFMHVAAKTPRSNCTMDSAKVASAGIKMTEVHEAVARDLRNWRKAAA